MDKGAHTYRCYLRVHTPRDINWIGHVCISDDERQAYAVQFVQACRERGINDM